MKVKNVINVATLIFKSQHIASNIPGETGKYVVLRYYEELHRNIDMNRTTNRENMECLSHNKKGHDKGVSFNCISYTFFLVKMQRDYYNN